MRRGPTLDGIGKYLREVIDGVRARRSRTSRRPARGAETEVVVSYLPVGAEKATRWYAEQALAAGCAFVNCIPVFIASDPDWRARFAASGCR